MPQRRTAIKDLRQNRTRHLHNMQIKTDLKKCVKQFTAAAGGKKAEAADLLKEIYKKFDKAAKRGIMHKKTAARRKSGFAKLLAAK
ncbi:MAG: 30S ribosomal protein S20 [Candidatus Omnitrophica bacterium]|nr:30S ribosomal protein S20 [Candidatus Omnitrophota bacterium]MDE2009927.1 30S ribosomal protein S20 [Candidatus Omnitrophota bacterium]MDE2215015.1 30S ribosomal protein S20 [Candidatus Omnitrophota bacterium]MDE2232187.1 30S ribosomal protein S20 [Candidatus Omnitrophota bacterium]